MRMSWRSAKPSKPPNHAVAASKPSSVSSHLAMVELKQRILTSLNKIADRDTHQIAVEDLEDIIQSLSNDGVSMVLNCLYDAVNDSKPAVKKEGVRLLAFLCAVHTDPAASHLTKIIAHIVKRLKDSDSQVREVCRDATGSLAGLYLKGGNGGDGVVSLFVKPLFEVMCENNKTAQGGAALCLAKVVECAADPPLVTFQKLCTRVCKYLNSSNFMAKASMLQVVSSLSQVGAITHQNLEPLLQCIHECLRNPDWATRKAAADTLIVLSSKVGNIAAKVAASTFNTLEACRFDKVKPVRESMTEALQLWRKIAGIGDGTSEEHKASSQDGDASESANQSNRNDPPGHSDRENEKSGKNSSSGSSPADPNLKGKGTNIMDKAVGILKKRAPSLTDKELNPEFFQNLETRVAVPVEVILPRCHANSSVLPSEEESESDPSAKTFLNGQSAGPSKQKHGTIESGTVGDCNHRGSHNMHPDYSRNSGQSEGMDNKGNWLAIQRQSSLLQKQQAQLMNLLQDFMSGSHDSMVTLENRVRGLERIVEDMARDLSISSGRRGFSSVAGFEGTANRSFSKYNGFLEYSNGKLGRGGDGHFHFGDRFATFDGVAPGIRSRGSSWRSDALDVWDLPAYGKNGHMVLRRAAGGGPIDQSRKSEHEAEQVDSRKAWEKGSMPVRFGEGPSARSVWQASKDEATLAAIRVAGEDNGVNRSAQVPERTAEGLGDDRTLPDRDPVWTCWSNAMDALHVGDMDSAFAEVLSTGDDFLLVKLMDKSGPVFDQLSNDVAIEVANAISQFLMDQNLFDTCLYWVHQLADIVMENGHNAVGIPMEIRREIILNLQGALSSFDIAEDWEGLTPDQVLIQLASAWEIDLQHFGR